MSKNGQVRYFQHFLGVRWKILPKVTVYPENFGTENLAHFFMLFYIYCYNAISFCDFKTHSDPPGAPLGPPGVPLTPVCHPEP